MSSSQIPIEQLPWRSLSVNYKKRLFDQFGRRRGVEGPLYAEQQQVTADTEVQGTAAPIPGLHPELPWREWLPCVAPRSFSVEPSDAHAEIWEWFYALRGEEVPPALIVCINRGGGKTTSLRWAVINCAAAASRNFVLYVSRTQKDANRHVQSVGHAMERHGVQRAMSVHGFATGWSADQLRTASGFTILAFGLNDAASRGVNLDDQRPDLVCHQRGTEVYDNGTWTQIERHPSALHKICDGLEVGVQGLHFKECVTPDHRYWTKVFQCEIGKRGSKKETHQESWTEARDLTTNHYIGYPIDMTVAPVESISRYKPGNITARNTKGQVISSRGTYELTTPSEFHDPDWWWLFGVWWGDGHLAGRYQVGCTIANTDKYIGQRISSILARAKIRFSVVPRVGCYQIMFSHALLNRWLRTWKSGNSMKQPPQWVERIALPFQRELVRGYLDADGFVDPQDGGVRLTSVHVPGLLCVRRLLMRLGIPSTIRKGPAGGKSVICGVPCETRQRFDLRFQEGGECFGARPLTSRYSFRRVFIRDGTLWSKFKGSRPVSNREFIPITTTDHTYLTHFGRSHNCFDDIDVLGESNYQIGRKKDVMAATVIPSGAVNCAYVFVQNAITAGSIMSQVLDGRFPILANRKVIGPIPAVYDLQWESYKDEETGLQRARITAGTPSWAGKPIAVCQKEIDDQTISVFLRESQHDIKLSGVFFQQWNPGEHVRLANQEDGPCHRCGGHELLQRDCADCGGTGVYIPCPWPIPDWWKLYGGLDYGRSAASPFYFALVAIDDAGRFRMLEEVYGPHMSPELQAEKVTQKINIYGRKLSEVTIYCGPEIFDFNNTGANVVPEGADVTLGWSMFRSGGKMVSDIYREAGLNVIPAMRSNSTQERLNRATAMNRVLDKQDGFYVYDGRCPNFCRTIGSIPPDPNLPNAVDTTSEDHPFDGCGFIARNHVMLPENPQTAKKKTYASYLADMDKPPPARGPGGIGRDRYSPRRSTRYTA